MRVRRDEEESKVSGRAGSSASGRAPRRASHRAEQRAARRAAVPADIWVLVSAAFIVALGYGLIAPILPQFAASFDLGVTAASVVVSSFAFFRLVFAPAGGRLVDRLGERRVYVAGLLIVAASTGAVAAAQDYWQLLLFRGLGGIGSTMFTVSAMALIIRLAPPEARGRASGLYASSFVFGNIMGPVAGGLLAGLGMRLPFVIYAVGLVIAALVVWVRLERQPQLDSKGPAGGEGASAEAKGSTAAEAAPGPEPVSGQEPASGQEPLRERMRFRDAWRDSAYKAALGSGLAVGWAAMGARIALYPLFVVAVLGADPTLSGVALTVFSAGMAVSVSQAGRIADSRGRRPLLIVGLGVLGASTIAVGLSDSIWVFFVLSLFAGLGGGLINPAQQAALGDIIGPHRKGGTVLSRFQMAQDLGAIAGPIVSGMLVDALNYGWAFAVTGTVALLACLGWMLARETLGTPPR